MELDFRLVGQKTIMDEYTSKHLLSLLYKLGPSSSIMDVMGSSVNMIDYLPDTTSITNFKMGALFGAALMDELHLVQAPLLVQRDPIARISGSNIHQSLESQLHTYLVLTPTHSLNNRRN